MEEELCPVCAGAGKTSRIEALLHDKVNILLCEDNDCPFNYQGHHVTRPIEDSRVSPRLLDRLCPQFCPDTLRSEPLLRYRHLMTLMWLSELRKADVYCWLQEEVGSMAYCRLRRLKYQLTPSADQLIRLTDEEVQVGKHVIPDLRKIVVTLRVQYQNHLRHGAR